MHNIFVYGTLKKGYSNHILLKNSNFLGTYITKEKYRMVARGIPYVNKNIPMSNITGELYEIDDITLNCLDKLEGYNPNNHDQSWYKRESITVKNENGEEQTAFIYFNENDRGEVIQTGNYDNYSRINQ